VQFLPWQDHVVPLKDGVFHSIFVDVLGVIQGQVGFTVFRKMLEHTSMFLFISQQQIRASHVALA
jgi:hypothetical protein